MQPNTTKKSKNVLWLIIFIAVAVGCAITVALFLHKREDASVGIVATDTENDITVERVGEGRLYGYKSMDIHNGDLLSTGRESQLTLRFDDGQRLIVGDNTRLVASWQGKTVNIDLQQGEVIAVFNGDEALYKIRIATPKVSLEGKNNVFVAKVVPVTDESDNTKLYAMRGDLTCRLFDAYGAETGETKQVRQGRCINVVSDAGKADYWGGLYYVRAKGFAFRTLANLRNISTEHELCLTTEQLDEAMNAKSSGAETRVTYVSDIGESLPDEEFEIGSVTLPQLKDNLNIFEGWFLDEEYSAPADETKLIGDVTLFAKWIPAVLITVDDGTGETLALLTAQGQPVGELPTPETETENGGFTGWYYDAGRTLRLDPKTTLAMENMTVYADFQDKSATELILSFVTNGGDNIESRTYKYGTIAIEPDKPQRKGFSFAGWFSDAELTRKFSFPGTILTKDTAVYAKWKPQPGMDVVTVRFDAQGGSPVTPATVLSGATIQVPEPSEKIGNMFAGWAKNAGGTVMWSFEKDRADRNLTLYAVWEPVPQLVRFDTMGGSPVADMYVGYGEKISPPPSEPTKDGAKFTGWYMGEKATEKWKLEKNLVSAPTLLYAGWDANIYTVTFEPNGGVPIESIKTPYGYSEISSVVSKEGCAFAGWYKDAALTQPWTNGTDGVTEDITLYAKWDVLPIAKT